MLSEDKHNQSFPRVSSEARQLPNTVILGIRSPIAFRKRVPLFTDTNALGLKGGGRLNWRNNFSYAFQMRADL
jgi:hypothetical protein